jgi:hypothetical protein
MAMTIELEGIDSNSKEAEIYDYPILLGRGRVIGPNSDDRRSIVNVAERHGIDAKKFKVLFRDYKPEVLIQYKGCSVTEIERLPPRERANVMLGTVNEFVFNKNDIIWLREFSRRLTKEIVEKDDLRSITKKADTVKGGGNLHDVLTDYEYDVAEAESSLGVVLAICEKALELGVNLKVVT